MIRNDRVNFVHTKSRENKKILLAPQNRKSMCCTTCVRVCKKGLTLGCRFLLLLSQVRSFSVFYNANSFTREKVIFVGFLRLFAREMFLLT